MNAIVTDDSPLTIQVAGADTTNPADSIDGLALSIGDIVTIDVRTPQKPLVTAVEVAAP